VDYGTDTVTLTVIPERPTFGLLGFLAMAALFRRRR
jgi:uncharacterized protein (TIGR03382 family)